MDEKRFAPDGADTRAGLFTPPGITPVPRPFKIGPAFLTLHWPLDASALLKSPAVAMKNRFGSMRCRMTEMIPSDVNPLICFSRFAEYFIVRSTMRFSHRMWTSPASWVRPSCSCCR